MTVYGADELKQKVEADELLENLHLAPPPPVYQLPPAPVPPPPTTTQVDGEPPDPGPPAAQPSPWLASAAAAAATAGGGKSGEKGDGSAAVSPALVCPGQEQGDGYQPASKVPQPPPVQLHQRNDAQSGSFGESSEDENGKGGGKRKESRKAKI